MEMRTVLRAFLYQVFLYVPDIQIPLYNLFRWNSVQRNILQEVGRTAIGH